MDYVYYEKERVKMKRRIYVSILSLLLCLVVLPVNWEVNAKEDDATPTTITKEELCNVFPEYSEKIAIANTLVEQKARVMSIRNVEERASRETEAGDVYSITLYDDGTYTAARYITHSLTGTETSTSTKYTMENGSLIISDIKIGANRMFTFDGISFTINKYSYDKLDSFYEVGTAAIEENGKVVNYWAKINSFVQNETSSMLAGAHFYIANNYFIFQVGNNGWSVILDGGEVISVAIF